MIDKLPAGVPVADQLVIYMALAAGRSEVRIGAHTDGVLKVTICQPMRRVMAMCRPYVCSQCFGDDDAWEHRGESCIPKIDSFVSGNGEGAVLVGCTPLYFLFVFRNFLR